MVFSSSVMGFGAGLAAGAVFFAVEGDVAVFAAEGFGAAGGAAGVWAHTRAGMRTKNRCIDLRLAFGSWITPIPRSFLVGMSFGSLGHGSEGRRALREAGFRGKAQPRLPDIRHDFFKGYALRLAAF